VEVECSVESYQPLLFGHPDAEVLVKHGCHGMVSGYSRNTTRSPSSATSDSCPDVCMWQPGRVYADILI